MKQKFTTLFTLTVFLLASCNSELQPPSKDLRSYEQDAEILVRFVSIDKENLQYYFNPAKRSSLLSAAPDSYANQLAKVSVENKTKFIEKMNALNEYLKPLTQANEGTIVFSTPSEVYVKNLGKITAGISVRDRKENMATRAVLGTLPLTGFNGTQHFLNFTAGKYVQCEVNIQKFGGDSFLVTVSERNGNAKPNFPDSGNPYAITYSGYGSFYGTTTWTHFDYGSSLSWAMRSFITFPPDMGQAVFSD